MVGIVSYGAYAPFYRLKREEIAKAWGGSSIGGEKAIANFDEDSITMAVAAAMDCLKGAKRHEIDGLYLATTTSPYREKQAAAVVAGALDLPRGVLTGDFTGSLRSATIALRAAVDAVKAGSARSILVVASECRLGTPGSDFEQLFGDGAAAFVIGGSGVIAEIEGEHTHFDEIIDLWRTADDDFVKSWEDRFVLDEGYSLNMQEAVSSIMKKQNLGPSDLAKAVFYTPDARRHIEMAKKLGLDPKTQVQDPMFAQLGNTGTAFAPMMLAAALSEAEPGNRILLANYGDGCDAYLLRITEAINGFSGPRSIKGHLESKGTLPSYGQYVRYRQLMPVETGRRRPAPVSSAVALWRDRQMLLSLKGAKCNSCGRLFFPPQRVCVYCRAKDNYEMVGLSDMKGELYTFNKDQLAFTLDPPLVLSVVNLEGGCRFYSQMTDRDPEKIQIGMTVEPTFRKMHEAEGYHNYFWKCRPLR
ncbi:MAG: OB-fold domain-containing protein [Chloroflexota bacterium]|nr:OB-fold domain-containing protein [Chloroflexota bacterium]